jgi:epoxyqueuosine reductase
MAIESGSILPSRSATQHFWRFVRPRVSHPVASGSSKQLYRHISQSVCPWNVKFSQALAEDSPFRAREFIAGRDSVTLAQDILALDQAAFSAAFRKSPMKRAKLAALRRNAAVVLNTFGIASWRASPPPSCDPAATNSGAPAQPDAARTRRRV